MSRTGYWNKILHVDLTAHTWSIEEPGDKFFRLYGGGRGYEVRTEGEFDQALSRAWNEPGLSLI